MDHRDAEAFELTDAERELVCELTAMAVSAIEQACPRLVVQTIDLELRELAARRHLRSVV